jgi:hypothetical protein
MEQASNTPMDQRPLWHTTCAEILPIVVIIKPHRQTHKTAHGVRFSRALPLGYAPWSDEYRLRCPLAGHCRDAPQDWGREDCMHVNARPVCHGANLALCMVHVSHALMRPRRAQWSACSVHDRKAWFRGQQYGVETLKLLPEPPESIFIDHVGSKMAALGRVNHAVNSV